MKTNPRDPLEIALQFQRQADDPGGRSQRELHRALGGLRTEMATALSRLPVGEQEQAIRRLLGDTQLRRDRLSSLLDLEQWERAFSLLPEEEQLAMVDGQVETMEGERRSGGRPIGDQWLIDAFMRSHSFRPESWERTDRIVGVFAL